MLTVVETSFTAANVAHSSKSSETFLLFAAIPRLKLAGRDCTEYLSIFHTNPLKRASSLLALTLPGRVSPAELHWLQHQDVSPGHRGRGAEAQSHRPYQKNITTFRQTPMHSQWVIQVVRASCRSCSKRSQRARHTRGALRRKNVTQTTLKTSNVRAHQAGRDAGRERMMKIMHATVQTPVMHDRTKQTALETIILIAVHVAIPSKNACRKPCSRRSSCLPYTWQASFPKLQGELHAPTPTSQRVQKCAMAVVPGDNEELNFKGLVVLSCARSRR